MALKAEQLKTELVESVIDRVRDRQAKTAAGPDERFVRQVYANVPPDDIHQRTPEQLYGMALSLWQFGARRRPGTAKIRIHNPKPDEQGWQAHHTVVEIVNDDMPFLVDSVTAELNRHDLTVHLVIHPVIHVRRDADGQLTGLAASEEPGAIAESYMHVEVDEVTDPALLAEIEADLARVLDDVRAAVEDWQPMLERARQVLEWRAPVAMSEADREEANAFLRWMMNDHFTFLGYRDYRFEPDGTLSVVPGSGLGVLREDQVSVFDGLRSLSSLPVVRDYLRQVRILTINKSNRRATVHRPVPMDTIALQIYGPDGELVGERLFVGLFTSTAYAQPPRDIPYIRRKVEDVQRRAGFAPRSHDAKALAHILDAYPRDELFQISTEELYEIALGILHLQDRQRVALFVRRDPFERFVSCMVFVPRDRFDTDLRRRIGDILANAWDGQIRNFHTQLDESPLARVHYLIGTEPGHVPAVNVEDVEARLVEAARNWTDRLREALVEAKGEERGLALHRRYAAGFPVAYREQATDEATLYDIERLEEVLATGELGVNLYRATDAAPHELHFKLYRPDSPVTLSEVLPMLEAMGLRVISEIPYEVRTGALSGIPPRDLWIHDFALETRGGQPVEPAKVRQAFHDAFLRIWRGEMENDGFNGLVLGAGLAWRQIVVLRAYAKYLRQARFQFSQDTLESTLAAHPALARALARLFDASFNPEMAAKGNTGRLGLLQEIEHGLDRVANLDEDRILRRFLNLVNATLRTNFYQKGADDQPKGYVSFKLDSQRIDDLPLPRPMVEIFVYSPRVEAVHLRGGKVARGGIRWSDRREDFRTEILGLMKAQMVKNSVIVPVGSKGGFVVKRPPADPSREALMAEVVECYKTMMRGLLDVTDNIVEGKVVPPADVVRRDGDDPYLVVAADKGTATFSDIANGVSIDYGFWLGDAFASGGSAGYDHKKMGITARGAWEAVKRHFRELGVDIQNEDFTVVGVGDMSGDVFGNGMLLSKHIRLLAAFDHRHVFVDPDPDPTVSWRERERLFLLPRSSWADYEAKLISAGGGIWERSAKSIPISPQMKARFGIEADRLTPPELIQALLKASVDLLWFGGIGTFVKASTESHADAGDKANDALRIDGAEVGARVVGEGANLGFTQRGRIEYALAGGRINTDAIDNSAGVDTSDHEVNIKILLNDVVARGGLTLDQRNALLGSMTDEVGRLVLQDNYLQTQALTVAQAEGPGLLDGLARLMRALEQRGLLNRRIEYLPGAEDIARRKAAGLGLTRPELAVLLAYAKIALYDDLLPTSLPDQKAMESELRAYFPTKLREGYADAIDRHKLRREIIVTSVTNALVNRGGPTFAREMMDKTGMGPADVARAYVVARDTFNLEDLWTCIAQQDNAVPAAAQTAMLDTTRILLERSVGWFLLHLPQPIDIAEAVASYRPGIAALFDSLADVLPEADRMALALRAKPLIEQGVPDSLAMPVAALDTLAAAPDIVRLAAQTGADLKTVASTYFELGRRLGLDWLRGAADRVQADNHWQQQALAAVIDDLFAVQGDLTARALTQGERDAEGWLESRRGPVDRFDQVLAELQAAPAVDLAMLAVANRQLRGLVAG